MTDFESFGEGYRESDPLYELLKIPFFEQLAQFNLGPATSRKAVSELSEQEGYEDCIETRVDDAIQTITSLYNPDSNTQQLHFRGQVVSDDLKEMAFIVQPDQNSILEYNTEFNSDPVPITQHNLGSIIFLLYLANESHRQDEAVKLSEAAENQLLPIVEDLLNGRSDHPLVRLSSWNHESGFFLTTTIHDEDLHIEIYRHFKMNEPTYTSMKLHGLKLPQDLQGTIVTLNYADTSTYYVGSADSLYFEPENLRYLGQKLPDQTETKKGEDVGSYLSDAGAQTIAEILAKYQSAENFMLTKENEAFTPPTTELTNRLSEKIHGIATGRIPIEDMGLEENPGEKFRRHVAKLTRPKPTKIFQEGFLEDLLRIEITEHRDGDCHVKIQGKDVPKDIKNLDFDFGFSSNRFSVTKTLEHIFSFNVYKWFIKDARQERRIKKGYYSQKWLMSHRQAKVLDELLDKLIEGQI